MTSVIGFVALLCGGDLGDPPCFVLDFVYETEAACYSDVDAATLELLREGYQITVSECIQLVGEKEI